MPNQTDPKGKKMAGAATTSSSESKVFKELLEQLPILQEATTSRVVLNNDLIRFVLFSFDAGQLLTEHASPKAVVVQLLSGKMEFSVAGDASVLSPGDIVYLAPGERHALTALEACHMALTMVDVDGVEAKREGDQ